MEYVLDAEVEIDEEIDRILEEPWENQNEALSEKEIDGDDAEEPKEEAEEKSEETPEECETEACEEEIDESKETQEAIVEEETQEVQLDQNIKSAVDPNMRSVLDTVSMAPVKWMEAARNVVDDDAFKTFSRSVDLMNRFESEIPGALGSLAEGQNVREALAAYITLRTMAVLLMNLDPNKLNEYVNIQLEKQGADQMQSIIDAIFADIDEKNPAPAPEGAEASEPEVDPSRPTPGARRPKKVRR